MENKNLRNKFYWLYLAGFFLILALPIINIPPWLSPPDWGKTIIFRIIFSILIFLFLYQILFQKKEDKICQPAGILPDRKSPVFLPFWLLLSLLALYFLATIFSPNPSFSFWGSPERGGGSINFILVALFGVFVFSILRPSDWQKIWNFSFGIGILVSLIAIIQQFGLLKNIFIAYETRMPSTMGNPILLALYLLLLFFIALSFLLKEKGIVKKLFYIFAVLLFLYVILMTGSRAAYLGLVAGFFYFAIAYPAPNPSARRGASSKKILLLKISALIGLFLSIAAIYYINTRKLPSFFTENKIINPVISRLSLRLFLDDPRFSAWRVFWQGIKEKPILGWGPENAQIAFDKHYDPSLPYIAKDWGSWYDRAHNFVLDIGVIAGIPALIIYFLLIGVLFWRLHKIKRADRYVEKNIDNTLIYHSIQATLSAYLFANFFSFDSFSSYLLFFLIIAYSLRLIQNHFFLNNAVIREPARTRQIYTNIFKHRKIVVGLLFFVLICFIWFYNIKPLIINGKINISEYFILNKKCDIGLAKTEKIFAEKSFLDVYSRLKYVNFIKKCSLGAPEKDREYAEKGIAAMKEIVKIQPTYTGIWILLGGFTNVLIKQEKDPQKQEQLIKAAHSYFEAAEKLSPKRPEIFEEQAKTALLGKDYQKAIEIYNKLIKLVPSDYKYRAALVDVYIALEDIEKVKEEALKVLELNPPPDMIKKVEKLLDILSTLEKR